MIPLAAFPVAPLLAGTLLALLRHDQIRRWVEIIASLLVLLCAVVLAATGQPTASTLIAALLGVSALTEAIDPDERHQFSQIARMVRLAAMLAALLPVHALLTWLALAVAGAASAATRLPQFRAALSQLLPCNAALGLALFGAVALNVNSVTIGSVALLLGWGTLALLDTALLPVLLLLALRLQADVVATAHAGLISNLMISGGISDLLLIAAIVLVRARSMRSAAWLTLAQGGIALCAFGIGGPELRFAGLLHITLLVLTRSALLLSSQSGFDRLASVAGMSGLPPLGVFPSLALILLGTAIRAPWLLLPLAIGLVIIGWRCVRWLPQELDRPRASLAWIPLALALIVGLALPAPVAEWFAAAGDAAQ